MPSQTSRCLGVLRTERGPSPPPPPPKPVPGWMLDPTTFDFPVVSETIEGGWVDRIFRGDPELEPAYVAAAQRLVERGAVAISASCGFSIRYQAAVAAAVNVPVALSSLLLLPTLLRQTPAAAKIAVLVADSKSASDDMFGVDRSQDRARLVVGGVEGGTFWKNEMQRPPPRTEVAEIEQDVISCVLRLRAANPDIAAILLECTAFPLAAPAIRRMTRLPIYDITTVCRMTMASVT